MANLYFLRIAEHTRKLRIRRRSGKLCVLCLVGLCDESECSLDECSCVHHELAQQRAS